jgi:hypothetical protein
MKLIALNADDILRDVDSASSDRAGACIASLIHFDPSTATADFSVQCSGSRNNWEARIQLIDFNYIVPEEDRENIRTWDDLVLNYPEILQGDILVHCRCPAYQFWGHHYTLHQLDTALSPEDRFPSIRDPNLERVACKHLIAVLRTYF